MRIEFAVPSSRVLFLDFEAWHAVLNGAYLARSEAEDAAWERRSARAGRGAAAARREIQRSWERVFDFEGLRASDWMGSAGSVQAVVERVLVDEIREVREFRAR